MNMKRFLPIPAAALLLAISPVPGAAQTELIACSLGRAEQLARHEHNHLPRNASLPMTDVVGFLLDGSDLILLGRHRPQGTVLGLDEIAQLLSTAAVGGLTGPGVSLEPGSGDGYIAVYFGGPSVKSNWIGAVSYAADRLGKEMALGVKDIGVPGLPTYADRIGREMETSHQECDFLSRFWFAPAFLPVVDDQNLWLLESVQVDVLVQNISAKIGGVQQTNFVDKPAQDFANALMGNFSAVSARHPEIADMRAMMGSLQIASLLLQNSPSNSLAYWISDYKALPRECPQTAPVMRRDVPARGLRVEVHGGVRAAGLAIRLAQNDLSALRTVILASRPRNPKEVTWLVQFNQNFIPEPAKLSATQLKAADHFVNAARMRENRFFTQAASEFDAIVTLDPKAVEARFLAAICRREASVAAGQVSEMEKPMSELKRLGSALPNVPEVRYEWAVSLTTMGRDAEALPVLQTLLQEVPDYSAAIYLLGKVEYRLGDRRSALGHLTRYLLMAGDESNPWIDEAHRVLEELKSPAKSNITLLYDSGNFSMTRPSAWLVLPGSEAARLLSGLPSARNIEVAFTQPQDPNCNAVITVAPFPLDHLTRDQVIESLPNIEQTHRNQSPAYHRCEAGPIEINGVVGVRFIFTFMRLGQKEKQCVTTLVSRAQSVTLTCTAPEDKFDALWSDAFGPMNDQFRFSPLPRH